VQSIGTEWQYYPKNVRWSGVTVGWATRETQRTGGPFAAETIDVIRASWDMSNCEGLGRLTSMPDQVASRVIRRCKETERGQSHPSCRAPGVQFAINV
jgi:hypothetical protein